MNKSIGSIAVTERGQVVMLTRLEETDEVNNNIFLFDIGIILRGSQQGAVGAKCHIKTTEGLRVVGHVGELVRMLEESGVDLSPAERPTGTMSPLERIERLERENATLRANAAK
jgi:hypothetical protein